MADPRDSVRFSGIGYSAQTFLIDASTITYSATAANGSAQVGLAVTLSADATVALVGDGEAVLGKLISVEPDGKAVVQTGGYMTLPGGDGATLTRGTKIVGDLGAAAAKGYIQTVSTQHTVSRGMIISSGTATAVVVRLD